MLADLLKAWSMSATFVYVLWTSNAPCFMLGLCGCSASMDGIHDMLAVDSKAVGRADVQELRAETALASLLLASAVRTRTQAQKRPIA